MTNDPINCHTYVGFVIPVKAGLLMPDTALDAHNLNSANAHECKLGGGRTGGTR